MRCWPWTVNLRTSSSTMQQNKSSFSLAMTSRCLFRGELVSSAEWWARARIPPTSCFVAILSSDWANLHLNSYCSVAFYMSHCFIEQFCFADSPQSNSLIVFFFFLPQFYFRSTTLEYKYAFKNRAKSFRASGLQTDQGYVRPWRLNENKTKANRRPFPFRKQDELFVESTSEKRYVSREPLPY